jgi:hypothetical protein
LNGFHDLDSASSRCLLYVGRSRARVVLRLLAPQSCSYVEAGIPRNIAALTGSLSIRSEPARPAS